MQVASHEELQQLDKLLHLQQRLGSVTLEQRAACAAALRDPPSGADLKVALDTVAIELGVDGAEAAVDRLVSAQAENVAKFGAVNAVDGRIAALRAEAEITSTGGTVRSPLVCFTQASR